METAPPADATAADPFDAAALVGALGRGLPDGRLVVDRDVLAAMSHDEAEWAPVGRAVAGVRAETEAPGAARRPGLRGVRGADRAPRRGHRPVRRRQRHRRGGRARPVADEPGARDRPRQHGLRGAAGDREQRPEGGRGRARPVVPAGPGQRPVVVDRRERGHQRGRPVLPEVRRHPGLRARAARGDRGRRGRDGAGGTAAARAATARWSGWDGARPRASPGST